MGRTRRQEPINKDYEELGARIAMFRNEKGLSQKELAEIIGISKTSMANYETGTRKVSLTMLRTFADFFDISINELIGAEQPADDGLTKTIANNLRACRAEKDLTREEMSAELGISVEDLKQYERGGGDMPLQVIVQLAKFFNTSLDKLVGLTFGENENKYTLVQTDPLKVEGFRKWREELGGYSFNDEQIKELITFAKFLKFRDSENK